MHLFLTSSPTGDLDGSYTVEGLDTRNGFLSRLKHIWKNNSRCLIISASPDGYAINDEMTSFFQHAVQISGLSMACFDLWDGRKTVPSLNALQSYDVIFLGGGHVPTQNTFFQKIGLREKFHGFEGIVIGISAGTMNCCEQVYAQPEEPGEATDPAYKRFLPGLGLTNIMVLPHLQLTRYDRKDGLQLYEDITIADSYGNEFLAIPDGSYCYAGETGTTLICGEAWLIKDGVMRQVCRQGQELIYAIWNQ